MKRQFNLLGSRAYWLESLMFWKLKHAFPSREPNRTQMYLDGIRRCVSMAAADFNVYQ